MLLAHDIESHSIESRISPCIIIKLNYCKAFCQQGSLENSEDPGKRERRAPLRGKRVENFQCLEAYFEKLLLVYFRRPPRAYEAIGVVMKPLGPWDNLPPPRPCSLSVALSGNSDCTKTSNGATLASFLQLMYEWDIGLSSSGSYSGLGKLVELWLRMCRVVVNVSLLIK